MRRSYASLPKVDLASVGHGHVGLIGCGNYAYSNIAYYLRKNYGSIIRAAMDVSPERAASLFDGYGLHYYTTDAEQIINDPSIDLVFVASNHASHAEYAIRCIEAGKAVHIEKPHVVDLDQLRRLCSAMAQHHGMVGLGFNRPHSKIGKVISNALASEHGPSMLNWFVAGHEIAADHWYHDSAEGGRILGNLCHWTDFVYHIVPDEGRQQVVITPTRWGRADCDIAVTFLFSEGTTAIITFSAKGPTFEGVRERFSAHRGHVLISMHDFKEVTVERNASKQSWSPLFRDHGHENAVRRSYEMSTTRETSYSLDYVWQSGRLFLAAKESLERNEKLTINLNDGLSDCVPSRAGLGVK